MSHHEKNCNSISDILKKKYILNNDNKDYKKMISKEYAAVMNNFQKNNCNNRNNLLASSFSLANDKEMASKILSPRPPPENISALELSRVIFSPASAAKLPVEESETLYSKPKTKSLEQRKKLWCFSKKQPAKTSEQVVESKTDEIPDMLLETQNEELLKVMRRQQPKVITPLLPPVDPHSPIKKCFVIDLDETLVHSSFLPVPNADLKLTIEIDNRNHQIYVSKRPFCDQFLKKLGHLYECVLFTASLSKYADPVTDFIDPNGIFKHRLFREHCVFFNGNYVKDLSQLGRDVNQCLILDNSPVSFLFHPNHAIRIISWFDDPHDRALLDLIPYFQKLSNVPNVPEFLSNHPPPVSATGPQVLRISSTFVSETRNRSPKALAISPAVNKSDLVGPPDLRRSNSCQKPKATKNDCNFITQTEKPK